MTLWKNALVCLLALSASSLAVSSKSYFGQLQSHLQEYQGSPLISANWDGKFRAYRYVGKWEPLLSEEQLGEWKGHDFYSPTPVSSDELLFSVQLVGKKHFDILWWAKGKLRNLKSVPNDADEGSLCLRASSRLLSFHRDRVQVFGKLDAEGFEEIPGAAPAFNRCVWVDDNTVVGSMGRSDPPYVLFVCRRKEGVFACDRSPLFDDFEHFVDFAENGKAFIGLKKDSPFRALYRFSSDFTKISKVAPPTKGEGDLLEITDGATRWGYHARYSSSLAPKDSTLIFKLRKIGKDFYAVAADVNHPRSLARLDGEKWKMIPGPGFKFDGIERKPKEIWIGKTQAFYFGPDKWKNIVLWLHGGPRENVSPRFHPYFAALEKMGWGVLALNYPGSTGQGREFEQSFNETNLDECLRSAFVELKKRGATRIVSWSVSTGNKVQKRILALKLPVENVVDQSGNDPTELRELTAASKVKYFSIRGKYDSVPEKGPYDFIYDGGHDISNYAHFDALMEKLKGYLQ